jgi:RNA polymerase sigma factor (sigma-70 family)
MSVDELQSLRALIDRMRAGDERAADEVVARYQKVVLAAVRVRLTDPRLRRQFDSMDVCQSVMAHFLRGAVAGDYEIGDVRQLVGLLVTMTQRKVRDRARGAFRQRRDIGRLHPTLDPDVTPAAGPGPDEIALHREVYARLLTRLSPPERELVERRAAGWTWAEIADALGGSAQGRRAQLRRALAWDPGETHTDD